MLEAKILRLEKPRCFVSCKQTFVYVPFGYIPFCYVSAHNIIMRAEKGRGHSHKHAVLQVCLA